MDAIYPQLTAELRDAIAASGGLPVRIEDPDTHKIYVLIEQPPEGALDAAYVRDALSKGLDALERGERVEWNPERIKQAGRRRLVPRKAQD